MTSQVRTGQNRAFGMADGVLKSGRCLGHSKNALESHCPVSRQMIQSFTSMRTCLSCYRCVQARTSPQEHQFKNVLNWNERSVRTI